MHSATKIKKYSIHISCEILHVAYRHTINIVIFMRCQLLINYLFKHNGISVIKKLNRRLLNPQSQYFSECDHMRKLVVDEILSLKLIFTAKVCEGFDWIQLTMDKIKR
jgi:hypothetical protein